MRDLNKADFSYRLTKSDTLKNMIAGRYSIFNLEAPSGKNHFFEFIRPKEGFTPNTIFAYVRHNNFRYYLGTVENGHFRLTRNSKFGPNTESVLGAKYIVSLSNNQALLGSTPMKLTYSGRCCMCGRLLSSEKSIELGFGKRCYKEFVSEFQRGL